MRVHETNAAEQLNVGAHDLNSLEANFTVLSKQRPEALTVQEAELFADLNLIPRLRHHEPTPKEREVLRMEQALERIAAADRLVEQAHQDLQAARRNLQQAPKAPSP